MYIKYLINSYVKTDGVDAEGIKNVLWNYELCYLKRLSPPCYAYLEKRSTNFVHALVYNFLYYRGNSHQNPRFYP